MEGIQNLFDGFVVMLFFIAVFPFLANAIRLVYNFFRAVSNVLAI
ncbi:hypothetical protein [Polaribacter sp.]